MVYEYQLRVLPQTAADTDNIKQYLAEEKGLPAAHINAVRILRRSIDARQHTVYVNLTVRAYVDEEPDGPQYTPIEYGCVDGHPQVIVVGAGPGGLFAALRLIELGLRPVVVERGKDVHERKKDIARISREQTVDPESNYSFGEGGAGAYSDGKLYTRSTKRGDVGRILGIFCQHGASESILVDAHPHIGTDRLPRVIENMRNTIIKCGGEVHFQTRMTGLLLNGDKVEGIMTEDGTAFRGPVILATGHSARDVYRWLWQNGVEVESKGIAMGVRLEHPSHRIDQIQYHNREGRGNWLPAAEYSFTAQVDDRGVYSFCMCPGGFVVPAASGPEQIVVNGMSPANRGSKWSNSGMVVEYRPTDWTADHRVWGQLAEDSSIADAPEALRGMYIQEALERLCWQQGNRHQTAPAQRMADFVNGRLSSDLPSSSYAPGLIASPLHFWMPPFISTRLRTAFKVFGRRTHGFLTDEAVAIGVETRTSSPVRIVRDRQSLQHVRVQGLFPCGEGAGYAGGIVSAGIDGERCAEAAAAYINS